MNNIKITVDIDTLRKKLRLDYKYEDMANMTGIQKTKVHRFLNNDTKTKDISTFIKLCILAGLNPMTLIKIEKGEN